MVKYEKIKEMTGFDVDGKSCDDIMSKLLGRIRQRQAR